MRLYLVQHGEALAKDQDAQRPLSEKGRGDVQRMASFLARGGARVTRVIHSGKRRAMETAMLLADVLGPGGVVEEAVEGLAPDVTTDRMVDASSGWSEDIMVVGHLPLMGRLVSRLVARDDKAAVVDFKPGTVVCLERQDNGDGWTVAWMVRPELMGV